MTANENGAPEREWRRGGVVRRAAEFHVTRPAGEAFDFWTDVLNELRYNPSAVRVEQTTPGPVGLGTAWEGEYRGMRPLILSVVANNRARRLPFRNRASRMGIAGTFVLTTTAEGTGVTLTADLQPRGLFRLAAPLMVPLMRRKHAAATERLRRARGWRCRGSRRLRHQAEVDPQCCYPATMPVPPRPQIMCSSA